MRKIVQKNEVSIMKLSARRGLECRILHHLSQSFLGAAQGPKTPAVKGTELAWGPLKALRSSGINGAKSCILGLSWHLISLLKLLFFVLFFSYFQQLFKIKDPFLLLLIILTCSAGQMAQLLFNFLLLLQNLLTSLNVVSSTPRLSMIQTHNISGDRHK